MALNQTNRLVWIVETIRKARRISFGELNRKWNLDRVKGFRLSSHSFAYPEDFAPEVFFEGCFGIIADRDYPVEDVLLKVSASQANYLRDLPLHNSQKEVEEMNGGEYCCFRLHVRPTYDFQQELLWNREELEVLEPAWLREEMKSIVGRMAEKYRGGRK